LNSIFILSYTFLPLFIGIILSILKNNLIFEPRWFYLSDIDFPKIIFICTFLLLSQYFLIKESNVKFIENDKYRERNIKKSLFSLTFFIIGILTGFNFREFADLNSLNLIYSSSSIFILLIFFSNLKFTKFTLLIYIFVGLISGISGSKATLINFFIFYYGFIGNINLYTISLSFFLTLTIIKFFPFMIMRYLDQGLSMITISSLCQESGISTFQYYLNTFYLKLEGISFNPLVEFLKDFDRGGNITPTLAGDLYCLGDYFWLGIIFYLSLLFIFYLLPAHILKYRKLERAILIFTSLNVINSTFMDFIKFGILSNIVILFTRIFLKRYSNHTKNII